MAYFALFFFSISTAHCFCNWRGALSEILISLVISRLSSRIAQFSGNPLGFFFLWVNCYERLRNCLGNWFWLAFSQWRIIYFIFVVAFFLDERLVCCGYICVRKFFIFHLYENFPIDFCHFYLLTIATIETIIKYFFFLIL